jgi:hypothetical protein
VGRIPDTTRWLESLLLNRHPFRETSAQYRGYDSTMAEISAAEDLPLPF